MHIIHHITPETTPNATLTATPPNNLQHLHKIRWVFLGNTSINNILNISRVLFVKSKSALIHRLKIRDSILDNLLINKYNLIPLLLKFRLALMGKNSLRNSMILKSHPSLWSRWRKLIKLRLRFMVKEILSMCWRFPTSLRKLSMRLIRKWIRIKP